MGLTMLSEKQKAAPLALPHSQPDADHSQAAIGLLWASTPEIAALVHPKFFLPFFGRQRAARRHDSCNTQAKDLLYALAWLLSANRKLA